jgi:serine protease Do
MKKNLIAIATLMGCSTLVFATSPQDPSPEPKSRIAPKVRIAQARPARPALAYAMAYGEEMSGSYLGVDIGEVTPDRVAALKLKEERGVEIKNVDQDAPAGKAGLKVNDVVLDFNGERLQGEASLRRLLRETPPGRTVTLGIVREGQPQQIKVTLGDKKAYIAKVYKDKMKWKTPEAMAPMPRIEMPAIDVVVRSYSRTTGMMVDNLTPQLGEFFGVKSGEGVLVRSVERGSVAEASGLKAGDVIVKVDEERISDRNDFNRALRRKEGKTNIVVVREKREQTLSMNVPPRRAPRGEDESFLRIPDFDFDRDFEFKLDGDFDFDFDRNFDFDFDFDGDSDRVALPKRINNAFAYAAPLAVPMVEPAEIEFEEAGELIEFDEEAPLPPFAEHTECPENGKAEFF